MPISVPCPACGKTINAPDAAAGMHIECPKCDTPMTLPSDAPRMHMAGPSGPGGDVPKSGSGMAITGLVMGVVSICLPFIVGKIAPASGCAGWVLAIILAILGIVFSAIGMSQAGKSGSSKGMAIAGLILSILAIIWLPIYIFVIAAYFAKAVSDIKTEADIPVPRPAIVAKAEPQSRANDWALPS
jgi:hypothetical protein